MEDMKTKARELRDNMTLHERMLWKIIKNRQFFGYRFLRQYVIGQYIVDFVCREKRIVIELDGSQHNADENKEYDLKRTEYLNSKGYKVVRFWNIELNKSIEGVYTKLKEAFDIKD